MNTVTDTYQTHYSRSALNMRASDIRELLKYTEGRDVISFGGGMPDPAAFPSGKIAPIIEHVMSSHAADALQYGCTEGHTKLRRAIAQGMGDLYGVPQDTSNIVVTSGSQQALYFLAKLFLDPGDIVLTESPTFLGAILTFRSFLAEVQGISIDEYGMDMTDLEDRLRDLARQRKRPKFIYTVPTIGNPSGAVMSVERRKRLIELAAEYDTYIVEDDPYGLLLFDGTRMPLVKSFDDCGSVFYLGTFSKIIAPGFRVGWLAAPEHVAAKVAVAKQAEDLCTGTFAQHCVFEVMRHNVLLPHIADIVSLYRRKAGVMQEALKTSMPEGSSWTNIAGGLFAWVTLPESLDTRAMLPRAMERGVAYVAGDAFFPNGGGRNTMRLNFSFPSEQNIIDGVSTLGALMTDAVVR
ncbi:MAG: PLP-dependent aminotransferase family protein [Spirochaetes bacterium]|nr:PLP-dependent aminotransferase family protein [Spirochaetota bacterium]